jgi:hypothetical protein
MDEDGAKFGGFGIRTIPKGTSSKFPLFLIYLTQKRRIYCPDKIYE